jgi:hypothetical protein
MFTGGEHGRKAAKSTCDTASAACRPLLTHAQGGVAFGKKAKPSTPMDKLMHNDYMTGGSTRCCKQLRAFFAACAGFTPLTKRSEFESLQNSKLAQHTKSSAKIAVRASLTHSPYF